MYREVDPHIEEGNSPVKLFFEANKYSIELDGMNSGPWKAFELRFKDPLKPLKENHFFILLEGESTGRLLRYDPPTKTTHVVLDGLAFPNGIQLSKDQSFLLFTETTNCRLVKYWLEGSKRGEVEVVADLPGFPDNVRMNEKGEFWVAIDCCRTPVQEVLTNNPWIKSIYFRLPIPMKLLATAMGMRMYTVISRFDEDGKVLEVLEDRQGKVMKLVSEVREVQGKLWIGTVAHNHIATLPYPLAVNYLTSNFDV
ncbi:hypothetical protein DY000_02056628 [Brassica cretica]|uniref:Strictosidine synthase conserved region domain-containing protein n=1 Tax=Brassica cretica TaxID=69181 RepID=A0ABQ7AB50_BRACR|nr:hypothetical protein DY000_02056628 [Brassica cretica]